MVKPETISSLDFRNARYPAFIYAKLTTEADNFSSS